MSQIDPAPLPPAYAGVIAVYVLLANATEYVPAVLVILNVPPVPTPPGTLPVTFDTDPVPSNAVPE